MLEQHHKQVTVPGDLNLKLVMTEHELDRWYAFHTGIDIEKFPPYRLAHINKQAYEYLKKYANFNRGGDSQGGDQGEGAGQSGEFNRVRKVNKNSKVKKQDSDAVQDASLTAKRKLKPEDYKMVFVPSTKRAESVAETIIA